MPDLRWVLVCTLLPAASLPPLTSDAQIKTELVASGLDAPTFLTSPPGDTQRLFVVEKLGAVRIIKNGTLLQTPFLDLSARVPDVTGFDERGFVGLAFHPDYAQNGYFYVCYYNNNDQSVIARYTVSGNPDIADPNSAFPILVVDQPHEWHNANTLAFGPLDGYLYIGLGDGGPSGDPDNRAQNASLLYGKILRIDVDGGTPYGIPGDNPFVSLGGAADEVWALGLRNPYRFSFDRLTGDMYLGDVGQDSWEELDFEPASSPGGANYGWRLMEGNHCHIPPSGCDPGGLTMPVYEYSHGGDPYRCSVTGGSVYRGSLIPEIQGHYFFADFCSGQIWSFKMVAGNATELTDWTSELAPGGGLDLAWISAIAEDAAGELYILDNGDGEVFKIVPTLIGVAEGDGPTRAAPRVAAPQPNPFSVSTTLEIDLPRGGPVEVAVYDATGRLVRSLETGDAIAGVLRVAWDGRDASGQRAAQGIYFMRVATRAQRTTQRVVLVH